jgi:hypothetical protein
VLAKAGRGLNAWIDVGAAEQVEILGLVAERVDVRARVLRHHDHSRGAGAGLAKPRLVTAVQRVEEARRVRRVSRRAVVPQLLQVVDATVARGVEQVWHASIFAAWSWSPSP